MFVEPTFVTKRVPVSVDVGHSATKFALMDRGTIRTGSFPSVALRSSDTQAISSAEGIGVRESDLAIEVDGIKYLVDTAEDEMVAGSIVRTELDSFPTSAEYQALLYAGLVQCQVRKISRLVLGLPYHTHAQYAAMLVEKFQGSHNFGHGTFTVETVSVLPQPLGTYVAIRATRPSLFANGTSACVVDCGWGTTDVFVSSPRFKIDHERSGGLPGGAAIVLRKIASLLKLKFGGRFDNLDRIDQCIVNGVPLLHKGQEVDLVPFLSEASHVTRPIANSVLNILRTVEDLTVVASGGAAHYYLQTLRDTLGCEVTIVDHPRYANARGFLLAGEAAIKGGR